MLVNVQQDFTYLFVLQSRFFIFNVFIRSSFNILTFYVNVFKMFERPIISPLLSYLNHLNSYFVILKGLDLLFLLYLPSRSPWIPCYSFLGCKYVSLQFFSSFSYFPTLIIFCILTVKKFGPLSLFRYLGSLISLWCLLFVFF